MICSSRRPVRSAMSHVRSRGRREERRDQLVRRHVAAQHERALLQVAGQLASLAMNTNARASLIRPSSARRAAMVEAVSPSLDHELDLLRVVGDRLGQGGAEVLADEVRDERQIAARPGCRRPRRGSRC